MGREASCRVRWGGKVSEGQAFLETADIRFRGDFRVSIPFADMQSVSAKGGVLSVKTAGGTAAFALGAAAEKWAHAIRNPKSVLEKLGVKSGMTVSTLGVDDAAFLKDARAAAGSLSEGKTRKDSDLVFLSVESVAGLKKLAALRDTIRPEGGIWVVWPKGQPHIKEDHARAAGKAAGLVDVKVVAFSATHSALKLVIPVSQRR